MSRWIGRYAHFLSYVSCPKTQTFALRFLDSRRLLPSLTCHSSFEKAPKIECASLDWREESDAQPRGARRPGAVAAGPPTASVPSGHFPRVAITVGF